MLDFEAGKNLRAAVGLSYHLYTRSHPDLKMAGVLTEAWRAFRRLLLGMVGRIGWNAEGGLLCIHPLPADKIGEDLDNVQKEELGSRRVTVKRYGRIDPMAGACVRPKYGLDPETIIHDKVGIARLLRKSDPHDGCVPEQPCSDEGGDMVS